MKRLIFALAALLPATAMAAGSLPVSRAYCDSASDLSIARGGIVTVEEDYVCAPEGAARNGVFRLNCVYQWSAAEPSYTIEASFAENVMAGTLTYTEIGEEPIVLHQCP